MSIKLWKSFCWIVILQFVQNMPWELLVQLYNWALLHMNGGISSYPWIFRNLTHYKVYNNVATKKVSEHGPISPALKVTSEGPLFGSSAPSLSFFDDGLGMNQSAPSVFWSVRKWPHFAVRAKSPWPRWSPCRFLWRGPTELPGNLNLWGSSNKDGTQRQREHFWLNTVHIWLNHR